MNARRWLLVSAGVLIISGIAVYMAEPEYAYVPPAAKVQNAGQNRTRAEIAGPIDSRPDVNEASIDQSVIDLGRKAFYGETFGNEVFLTDIMGILDGPLTLKSFMKALLELGGRGTTNLQVELDKTATIAGQTFTKGTKIDTGLDVPKGAWVPLGMPVRLSRGRVKVGISCAACHATVARDTMQVVEGAPNSDLNTGLLMGLAANSTAYFTHAEISALEQFVKEPGRTVTTSDGKTAPLPDPKEVEDAVDSTFLKWPPGFFDSTIDMKANPTKIPHAFTKGNHPYGWSGFAAAGPFHGLSVFSNNVHAQNSDSLSQAEAAPAMFGMDREQYLGTILQNAADLKYRYQTATGQKPSDFFAAVDPTPGVPGVNEMVKPPTWPKLTLVAPDGMFVSSPGTRVWEQNNAMAAWQNTLVPPSPQTSADPRAVSQGRAVFDRAGCMSCHAGPFGTNNRVVPVAAVGTQPSRAQAFKKTEKIFGPPLTWSFDTLVPVPSGARVEEIPTDGLDPEQIKLAWAHGGSAGGYKVQGLMGLVWTAPYLHDGGVSVGPNLATDLGVSGTLLKGIQPDPANSLRALLDRDLRSMVIAANRASPLLQTTKVEGTGHPFWVDSAAGFTKDQQDALIKYLLFFGPDRR